MVDPAPRRASAPGSQRLARNRAGDHGNRSQGIAGRDGEGEPDRLARGLPGPEPGPGQMVAPSVPGTGRRSRAGPRPAHRVKRARARQDQAARRLSSAARRRRTLQTSFLLPADPAQIEPDLRGARHRTAAHVELDAGLGVHAVGGELAGPSCCRRRSTRPTSPTPAAAARKRRRAAPEAGGIKRERGCGRSRPPTRSRPAQAPPP